ncbi:hypothetical protein ACIF8W_03730 [Streptomyces sp. NPDC085639]|uniref:hypothetical protein n=1 Tax=Streptomyces sp. NPDC085639 TaxID=3365734 RepID=UPI0037D6DBC1
MSTNRGPVFEEQPGLSSASQGDHPAIDVHPGWPGLGVADDEDAAGLVDRDAVGDRLARQHTWVETAAVAGSIMPTTALRS